MSSRTNQKSFRFVRVVTLACVFTIMGVMPSQQTPPTKERNIFNIWIDSDCSIWWMIGKPQKSHLPVLVDIDDENYYGSFDLFQDMIAEKFQANARFVFNLKAHKMSNYICTQNVVMTLFEASRAINDSLENLQENVLQDERYKHRVKFRYALSEFRDRDRRIISAARSESNVADKDSNLISEESTWGYKVRHGYAEKLEEKVSEYLNCYSWAKRAIAKPKAAPMTPSKQTNKEQVLHKR